MRIYLASPFFNDKENECVTQAENILEGRGFEVYSPRKYECREGEVGTTPWAEDIFQEDVRAIRESDVMVMLYHGNYSDSGTAWECGFAYGIGKPAIAVTLGENANLMVHRSVKANITMEELKTYDFETMPSKDYEGDMF